MSPVSSVFLSAIRDLRRKHDPIGEQDDYFNIRSQFQRKLEAIDQLGDFYAHDKVEDINPGLEIEGLGRFGMPLSEVEVQAIIAESHKAPFGKGTQTIVDEKVRRTWEVDGKRIKLRHPKWDGQMRDIVRQTCERLGVPGGSSMVDAQLYKLLVYEAGAMFKPHKDSEKACRMFGTLVICLPSQHKGGDLEVSFNEQKHTLSTAPSSEWCGSYMAWYADVLHEVRPITSGYRVVLTYNLIAKGRSPPPVLSSSVDQVKQLRETIRRWRETDDPEFLVYALEHKYTDASLNAAQLKGKDRRRVQCLMELRRELGIRLYLGSLEKSVTGSCDDGPKWFCCEDRDGHADDDGDSIHTLEFEIHTPLRLARVVDLDGNAVASSVDIGEDENLVHYFFYEERRPDGEDFGFTGNEGAQATHWYRDTALIIMPEDKWLNFLLNRSRSKYDSLDITELLNTEKKKLKKDPSDPEARANCQLICQLAAERDLFYDEKVFAAIARTCADMDRFDLLEKAVTRVRKPSPTLTSLSAKYGFEKLCGRAAPEDLAGNWKFRNKSDREKFEPWRRSMVERASCQLKVIQEGDEVVLLNTIREAGSEWARREFYPQAFKNAEEGDIAFAMALGPIVVTAAENGLISWDLVRDVVRGLAQAATPGINFDKQFRHPRMAPIPDLNAHMYSNVSAQDLAAFRST